jgi:exonuclease III
MPDSLPLSSTPSDSMLLNETPNPNHNLNLNLPQLTFACQNCNSLNISTECDKQLSKIISITSLMTNIIFLSDVRMGGTNEQCKKIKKMFLTNSNKNYHLYVNSSKKSRGVGILIDCSLQHEVISFSDKEENILSLKVRINGCIVNLTSIYGPNLNDKIFFDNIFNLINNDPNIPIVLGGDWNTTYSTCSNKSNIDTWNMLSPPSVTRSGWLNEICQSLDLLDPFRAFHPTVRDYTYIPRSGKKNRSRLDFFLIKSSSLQSLRSCHIFDSITNSLFDHKPIFLDSSRDKTKTKLLF